MADTQRHRILASLIAAPLSAAALADRLAIPRTRVYYHLGLLERHGFIEIAGMRTNRLAERIYRAVAASFRVDHRLLGADAASLNFARSALLEAVADDVRRVPADDDALLVQRTVVRMTAARRTRLRTALITLVEKFSQPDPDGVEVEIAVALFDLRPR